MSTRLVLLCAGATASARRGQFPDPAEPLDDGGRAKARALVMDTPAALRCVVAPTRAAEETAASLGLDGVTEPALRDIDHGAWTGRPLDAIAPAALTAWLAAPESGAPGGEAMAAVAARVGPWLDTVRVARQAVLAITHAAVIRAVLAEALAMPVAATLAIDIAPLSRVVLSCHDRWRLRELRRA